MSARFSLGIDLGPRNRAVALEDFDNGRTAIVEITQFLGPNKIGEKPTLPSALYIPHPEEFPEESLRLPWSKNVGGPIVGHFARDHGSLIPDRLVTSAKSWLSNFHIDPKKPGLPWKSDGEKLSPFECSRLYPEHIKEGFLYPERAQGRVGNVDEGQVCLTLPASFDRVARNLTADTADPAGLEEVGLEQEPRCGGYP